MSLEVVKSLKVEIRTKKQALALLLEQVEFYNKRLQESGDEILRLEKEIQDREKAIEKLERKD